MSFGHKRFKHYVVIEALLLIVLLFLAGNSAVGGGDAMAFLRVGIGARARGMGGAFTAIANDVTGSYWNPAGLTQATGICLGGAYESRFGGLSGSQYLAGTFSLPFTGFGLLWVNSDVYSVYIASAATSIESLSLGINGKLYSSSVSGENAQGFGFDLGALYRTTIAGLELGIGMISADIGWSRIRWEEYDETDSVAWVTRLGVALASGESPVCWRGSADLEFALLRPPYEAELDYYAKALEASFSIGGEVWFWDLAFRAGVANIEFAGTNGRPIQFTVGFGAQVKTIIFDATWIIPLSSSFLGNTYILSAEFSL